MADAVAWTDERIGDTGRAVPERQRSRDEGRLIVTSTVHGRDAGTGMGHGGQPDRERTVWIVTNGRNLDSRFGAMPGVVDILPSIVTHMELDMPARIGAGLDGQSFLD